MVGKLTFKQGRLIFKEGDQEKLKELFRKYSITPETVKEWFNIEINNACCSEPQLELVVLSDTRIAFNCLNCNTWRFKNKLGEHIEQLSRHPLTDSELKEKYPDKECASLKQEFPESELTKQIKEPQKSTRNLLLKLYGTDASPMGKLRKQVFNHFLDTYRKKHLIKPHPDGYITTCLFCGLNKLLINKFTGNTYCYKCRREMPFEYLFEILRGVDIFSIVEELRNNQQQRPTFDTKIEDRRRPTYNEIVKTGGK